VLANAVAIPFVDESFEMVTCFEMLEHLPYTSFLRVLKEINRVAKSNVILSLPDITTVYRVYLELPRIRPIKIMINHPFPRPPFHKYDGQHYWEIGKRNYPLTRIMHDIKQAGFNIQKSYRIFEFPYHRFFILTTPRAKKPTSPRKM
jgi:ubiquinone/menaquinone biosynthesis C-methylase UbiE